MTSVAASAPGKVLLAGGYLVLDRDYTGLVFGLDARIHVHVKTLPTSPGVSLSEIIVRSPQFREAEWRYGYTESEDDGGIAVTQLKGHSTATQARNKFVETALAYALTYVSAVTHTKFQPAVITILADADYYSHGGGPSGAADSASARFVDFNLPLSQAHKTGLGSSAALVTAFTAAVLAHYLPKASELIGSDVGKARLHNLAQAAHCAAQGKVGSGFDVAAAVYGSSVYRRFSPSILEKLGELGMKGFSSRLRAVVEDTIDGQKWDTEVEKSSAIVPKGLCLVMCDVDCGSETVGMVKKVLGWRKDNGDEAALLWRTLQKANEELAQELQQLALTRANGDSDYENLRTVILTIRSLIREMSTRAGVPIEPRVQTDLLDACSRLSGVIGGMVPGAGGYDAIALLIKDEEEVVQNVRRFLDHYKADAASGEGDSIGKVRLLGVKQEMQGAHLEDIGLYSSWLS